VRLDEARDGGHAGPAAQEWGEPAEASPPDPEGDAMTTSRLSALVLAAGLAMACGSSGSGPVQPRYLYVGSGGSLIAGYAIDPETGALSELQGSPFSTTIRNAYLPASDGKGLLFGAVELGYEIEGFRVGNDGGLTSLGTAPISLASGPSMTTRDGRYLLVSGDSLHVYAVGDGGVLTEVDGSPFTGDGLVPSGAVQTRDGHVYVANASSTGGVSAFAIDAKGGLCEMQDQGSPFTAGGGAGFWLALSPDGTRMYEAGLGTGEVAGWTIDGTSGAVSPLPGSPWTTPGGSEWMVAVTAKYVYASEPAGVAGFTVGDDGALTAMDGSPFTIANPGWPFGLAADSSGRFVYLTDQAMNAIHGFTVGEDGALLEIDGSPWSTPDVPGGIVFVR